MRNFLLGISVFLCLASCDDGDIITVNLDFEEELTRCDSDSQSFLLYTDKQDPSESLSLIIPRNPVTEAYFTDAINEETPLELNISNADVRFLYRTYNRDLENDELCDFVQDSDLIILEDYEAPDGTVFITNTFIDDDEDGIPSLFEGADPNGDGDFSDAEDFDGDGIPNYQDKDDDNDNVETRFEIDSADLDGDNNPATQPLDTDGDTIPDYLDKDDDGDDVDTINEDVDGDGPRNDTSESNGEDIPFYLNSEEDTSYSNPSPLIPREFSRIVRTLFVVEDVDLGIILIDRRELGTFDNLLTVVVN